MPDAPSHDRFAFTVFTPTYNRAGTLPRVYESLRAQTLGDFEWLVVDDGSTDPTRQLVERWQREADFPIRYVAQDHLGKHIAFNRAVREARGRLFLNLDSDDGCVPTALERFQFHWDSIPEPQREEFSSVTALCVDQEGRLVGDRYPQDVIDSDPLEIRYRFKVRGEKWGFQRTRVLREHPFPETLVGQYVPECVVWSKIARRYKTRFVNEPLRIFHFGRESMVHGGSPARDAAGGRLQHVTALNEEIDFFRHAPGQFCRSAVHYARFSFHTGTSLRRQYGDLSNRLARLLWMVFLPVAFLVFLRDRK